MEFLVDISTGRRSPGGRVPIWLWLSLPIAVLGIGGSIAGIVFEGSIYDKETADWAAQAVGQDIANLVAFTSLLIFARLAARGSMRAFLGWAGVLTYSAYTYAIYVFDINFGPLFPVWVAVFGLSIFALIGGLSGVDPARVSARIAERAPIRQTAGLLLAVGISFYFLWMSEIVPALIRGTVPQAVVDARVPTNPVHVLDLSLLLPAGILAGILLLKRRPWGFVLTPVIMTAMIFIGLGIVSLTAVVAARDLEGSPAVGAGVALMVLAELVVVVRFLRPLRGVDVSSDGLHLSLRYSPSPPASIHN